MCLIAKSIIKDTCCRLHVASAACRLMAGGEGRAQHVLIAAPVFLLVYVANCWVLPEARVLY